jgi:hypothetical protein
MALFKRIDQNCDCGGAMRILGRLWTRNGFPAIGHVTTPRETLNFRLRRLNRRPDRFAVISSGRAIAAADVSAITPAAQDGVCFAVGAVGDDGDQPPARGVAMPHLEHRAEPRTVYLLMLDDENARRLSAIYKDARRR